MIGGGRPLVPEILDQTDRVGAKSPIFDLPELPFHLILEFLTYSPLSCDVALIQLSAVWLSVRLYVALVIHAQMVQDIQILFCTYDRGMFLVSRS